MAECTSKNNRDANRHNMATSAVQASIYSNLAQEGPWLEARVRWTALSSSTFEPKGQEIEKSLKTIGRCPRRSRP